jgi:DNA invertase Pin-like site-specific DNA recombinase
VQTTQQARASKAAIYARRSKDLELAGKNVASQVRDMTALAASKGDDNITEDRIHVDNDVSASRFARKQRTAWKELVAQIEAGSVRRIYTLWLNRLLRLPMELEHLINLALAGKFESIITESITLDLRTPEGQMMARQMAGHADMEVQQLSHRIKRKMDENRREGKATHGVVSFGWLGTRHGHKDDAGLIHHEVEAALIREAAQQVLAGRTLSAIAREWTAAGVDQPMQLHKWVKAGSNGERPTPNWMPNHIQRVLTLPRNAGYQTHEGAVVGQPWSPILDADTYAQLVAHFERRKYGARSARSSEWTGFVRCGGTKDDGSVCGATMLYTPAKNNRPSAFKCAAIVGRDACGHNGVSGHHVERLAHDWLVQLLDDETMRTLSTDDEADTAQLFARLQQLNQLQVELDEDRGSGAMPREAYNRASKANQREVEAVSRELASTSVRNAMTPYLGRGQFIRGVLDSGDMTADEHRALFLATGQFAWIRPQGFRHKHFDVTRVAFSEEAPPEWTTKVSDSKQDAA